MKMHSRVVNPSKLTAQEVAAWDELCVRQPVFENPFYSPHFTRAVGQCLPRVYVCVIYRDSKPVGFLPFQFRSKMHRVLGAAERIGGEMSDYFGLIAEPCVKLEPAQLLRLAGLKYLAFTHLDETQLALGLSGQQPEAAYRMRIESGAGYWEEIERTNKDLVKDTLRRQRNLEAKHGPFRFCTNETDWKLPLDHLLSFKRRQYLATGRHDLFADAWRLRLVDLLAASREQTCSGMVSTLYAGETWVASHFGIRCASTLHYWFPVYNPELNNFAPGRVILKLLVDQAPRLGIRLIDRGGGDARHKEKLSNETHRYYRGEWTVNGINAALCRIAESARWRLERLQGI